MKTPRRDFIKIAVAAAAVLLNNVSASAQKNTDADLISSDVSADVFSGKTATDFRRYVGAEFMFLTAAGAASAILSEVSEPSGKSKRLRRLPPGKKTAQNFVLSFKMAAGDFPQATYRLWHAAFGEFDLFLVPGRNSDESALLHAVINRR